MFDRLLCWLGLHDFEPWAYNSVIELLPIEKCRRCGVGRKCLTYGVVLRYSVEQMEEAAKELARREEEPTQE